MENSMLSPQSLFYSLLPLRLSPLLPLSQLFSYHTRLRSLSTAHLPSQSFFVRINLPKLQFY